MRKRSGGFTLVEIMIVVAIIGILIAIAIPGFIRARETSQGRACAENLAKIDGAKEQWALEEKKTSTDTPTEAALTGNGSADDAYIKTYPECPGGGSYTIGQIGTDPTCTLAEEAGMHQLN